MRMSLNHSGSYICILSPQKPGPKGELMNPGLTSGLAWARKMKRVHIWARKPGKALQLDGGTTDCLQFWLVFCLTDDKTEFFLLGLVSILWLLFFFFFNFFFGLKGCDRTAEGLPLLFLAVAVCVRWTVVRKRRRLQSLHAHGKTPDKAHGSFAAKEQIHCQASEVKERIHS